jgi:hypothetical protein
MKPVNFKQAPFETSADALIKDVLSNEGTTRTVLEP